LGITSRIQEAFLEFDLEDKVGLLGGLRDAGNHKPDIDSLNIIMNRGLEQ